MVKDSENRVRDNAESPLLIDEWWEWSVMKALLATIPIGIGSIAVALGASQIGWVLIIAGPTLYVFSPDVHGPIA